MYARCKQEANENDGKKYPKKLMVWVGLAFNGKCKVVVLPANESFNGDFYVKNVLPIVNRDGRRLIGDNFTFQQDGATCHTADISMATIEKLKFLVIPPNKWPPNSPDLNPLDYFFWNEVEERLKGQKYPTQASLVAAIKFKIREVPKKMIQEAIDQFRSRIHAVFLNKGGLILDKIL